MPVKKTSKPAKPTTASTTSSSAGQSGPEKSTAAAATYPQASAPNVTSLPKPASAEPEKKAAAQPAATSQTPAKASKTKTAAKPKKARTATKSKAKTKATARKATGTKKTTASRSAAPKRSIGAASAQSGKKAEQTVQKVVAASKASTESMLNAGNEAIQEALKTGAKEMQRVQEQALTFSKEGADEWVKSADNMAKGFSDAFEVTQQNMRTAVETGNVAAEMAKTLSNELFGFANAVFSEQVEHSRNLVNCRTANELFDAQNSALKSNMDMFFSESMRLSEICFKYASQASEPLNEQVNNLSKQWGKRLAS